MSLNDKQKKLKRFFSQKETINKYNSHNVKISFTKDGLASLMFWGKGLWAIAVIEDKVFTKLNLLENKLNTQHHSKHGWIPLEDLTYNLGQIIVHKSDGKKLATEDREVLNDFLESLSDETFTQRIAQIITEDMTPDDFPEVPSYLYEILRDALHLTEYFCEPLKEPAKKKAK